MKDKKETKIAQKCMMNISKNDRNIKKESNSAK